MRLADTGGALAAAEIRPWHPLAPPPVGACIILRGHVHVDEQHGWYAVDPLEYWQLAPFDLTQRKSRPPREMRRGATDRSL